jgi:hypothetical protein
MALLMEGFYLNQFRSVIKDFLIDEYLNDYFTLLVIHMHLLLCTVPMNHPFLGPHL